MTTRRVLVFDDDSAFIELMQSALEVYAFAIQPLELNPENIQAIKALKPQIIFICADLSDNAGYALCSEIRKALGKNIFIVCTTAKLSFHDLPWHEKLRLHANLYIDKRELSIDSLLSELDEKIGLGRPPYR